MVNMVRIEKGNKGYKLYEYFSKDVSFHPVYQVLLWRSARGNVIKREECEYLSVDMLTCVTLPIERALAEETYEFD